MDDEGSWLSVSAPASDVSDCDAGADAANDAGADAEADLDAGVDDGATDGEPSDSMVSDAADATLADSPAGDGANPGGGGSSVASSLAVGRSHSCVVMTDGSVRCWGF